MKIKTSDLIGPALDWAVAKCEGFDAYKRHTGLYAKGFRYGGPHDVPKIAYSADWSQGGPISEREQIERSIYNNEEGTPIIWKAWPYWDIGAAQTAPTPLVAEMRCFVASKLGDVVDVPEELT